MSIEVRRARPDEIRAFMENVATAFLETIDLDKADGLRDYWDFERVWIALDGRQVVGTFRSWPTEVTLPGGVRLPAGAVSAVTVRPTHRRQGIMRRMLDADEAAMRERGESLGILHAAEYPIYGRFGYGAACREATWELDTKTTDFHVPSSGSVEIVRPDASSRDAIRDVFDVWRKRQVGDIRRRDDGWDFDLGLRSTPWGEDWKGFLALHRDAGGAVDGYVQYHADDKWDRGQPRNTITVDELHGLTDDATVSLWRFLAEHDWAATVVAERRSPSDRLPWILTNARAARIRDQGDGLWVHLLDVPAALEARGYTGEGSLTIEIVGPGRGDRERVRLEASRDGARCRPSKRSPDVTVPLGALGAAYLGGPRLSDAAIAHGGLEEGRRGAAARLEGLLRTPDEPWCSTFF